MCILFARDFFTGESQHRAAGGERAERAFGARDPSGADRLFAGPGARKPCLFIFVQASNVDIDRGICERLSESVRSDPGSRDYFVSRKEVIREGNEIDSQP